MKMFEECCLLLSTLFVFRRQMMGTSAKINSETEKDSEMDEPIQYSTSRAHNWKAVDSLLGEERRSNAPWYQTYSVLASISVFLIYFCILREENDIDLELNKSLFDRVPELEETQIKVRMKYDKEHGKDTSALEARLQELQRSKIENKPSS